MSEPVLLTESIVQAAATPQSYARGEEYYQTGAIYNAARQGNILLGECEGSSAPAYRLHVELEEGGIRTASCTCPYEWGGLCKHIVALLLTYIYRPEEFVERRSVAELLADLDRDGLAALITRLVERQPDLYDWIETAAHSVPVKGKPGERRQDQVSDRLFRRQIRNILRSLDDLRPSEAYWEMSGLVEQLEEVEDTARQFLEEGDAESAITILMALFEEVTKAYGTLDDSDGELGAFLDDLGLSLAEAILSADLDEDERLELVSRLSKVSEELSNFGIEGAGMAIAAAERGWSETEPSWQDDEEEWEEDWSEFDLSEAKLNVLERQGRIDEFLALCQETHSFLRYALKLLDLGRVDEAIQVALDRFAAVGEALLMAQKLQDLGRLRDAIAVGERGLSLVGNKHPLGAWLGPVAESKGYTEQALQAYRVAFAEAPSIDLYRAIERLAGVKWPSLKPGMMDQLIASKDTWVLVDVYLSEGKWDAAIQLADQEAPWNYSLVDKVVDAVIDYRPEWVISACRKQAEDLIAKTQSKYYSIAARWLAKMKKAYIQLGREKEWQAYLENLRTAYPRRRALLSELRWL